MTEFVQLNKQLSNKPYQYKECGLDDVYLLNGYTEHKTPYGNGVSIDNADALHKAIALHICCDKPLIRGIEFRFLRKLMDMTQAEMAVLFGCDSQTVARWEKGESDIKGTIDRVIRILVLGYIKGAIDPIEVVKHISTIDDKSNIDMSFKVTQGNWKPTAIHAH
jgi:DNA-binding transcriptional regulator YiaG